MSHDLVERLRAHASALDEAAPPIALSEVRHAGDAEPPQGWPMGRLLAAAAVVLVLIGGLITLDAVRQSPDSTTPGDAPLTTSEASEPVEVDDVATTLPQSSTTTEAPSTTTEPPFDATLGIDLGTIGPDDWVLPTWLPDGYEITFALEVLHPAGFTESGDVIEGSGGATRSVTYEHPDGGTINLGVRRFSFDGLVDRPWTRTSHDGGYFADARIDPVQVNISADRLDAADFARLFAGAAIGTREDVPSTALISMGDLEREISDGLPVVTFDFNGEPRSMYAVGVNGYYCVSAGVCPMTIPRGSVMTAHGGGPWAGMSGSATITASPFGIVTSEVDRVEVEFIDGQRITAFPTDLTGRFDDKFWLVVTEIELDAPLAEPTLDGSEPPEDAWPVRTVTAYDAAGNILHVDHGH